MLRLNSIRNACIEVLQYFGFMKDVATKKRIAAIEKLSNRTVTQELTTELTERDTELREFKAYDIRMMLVKHRLNELGIKHVTTSWSTSHHTISIMCKKDQVNTIANLRKIYGK